MSRSVRLEADTAEVINELGGTFDNPDDVIRRLIEEAGYGEMLDQEPSEDSKITMSQTRTVSSASDRKEEFLNHLRQHDEITEIEKTRRSAWEVETMNGTKIIWIHYHVDFEFWGGSWNVNDQLSKQGELIHVFLGPDEGDWYIVPDDDLHSGQFTVYDTKDESQWKLSTERGSPPNGDRLRNSYTELAPIINRKD